MACLRGQQKFSGPKAPKGGHEKFAPKALKLESYKKYPKKRWPLEILEEGGGGQEKISAFEK